ncbi:MAG: hypothetical protein NWR45_01655 [Candidatus Nanopelagicales bacterium]|jgi:hypothetical protein|nr:hypothetical protein [Candidatus Nanopelagicales bacterium]
MVKPSASTKAEAAKSLSKATKQWRDAKKKERSARDALAVLVREVVEADVMSENKVSEVTDIPRMTIRKMLGKD